MQVIIISVGMIFSALSLLINFDGQISDFEFYPEVIIPGVITFLASFNILYGMVTKGSMVVDPSPCMDDKVNLEL